jgi:HJR/Mrr/RecB family endonuclease
LLYRYKKIFYYREAVQRLEKYGIDLSLDDETIIEQLCINGCPIDDIITTVWAINSQKQNYTDIINKEYKRYKNFVEKKIEEVNAKIEIESCLSPQEKESAYKIADIDLMSGAQFESFIADLFDKLGYKTYVTKQSGDQGIDVIAERRGVKIAIQAKCYTNSVGNKAVQEAVAGATYYHADKVMVITNSHFTKSARELAQANNVTLWDRNILIEKLSGI